MPMLPARALDKLLIAGSVLLLDDRVQGDFHADDLRHVELGHKVSAGRFELPHEALHALVASGSQTFLP